MGFNAFQERAAEGNTNLLSYSSQNSYRLRHNAPRSGLNFPRRDCIMAIHGFIRRLYQPFFPWSSRVIHPQPSRKSHLPSSFLKIRSFVLAKEPILKIADSRLLILIPLRSANTVFIKRALWSSILSHLAPYSLQHWWSGASPSINCGCLLRVPRHPSLRFMSSNTSRGLWPQTHLYPPLFLCSLPPIETL